MTNKEIKEKLRNIKDELSRGVMGDGFVKNVGKVFFRTRSCGCVLRDVVYYGSLRHGLEFELLSLDGQYFAGSKEHAEALQEHYGGRIYQSEYCHVVENPRELWIWELPIDPKNIGRMGVNLKPMDYDEAVAAIFDIV